VCVQETLQHYYSISEQAENSFISEI
jgi:hypothetical protein